VDTRTRRGPPTDQAAGRRGSRKEGPPPGGRKPRNRTAQYAKNAKPSPEAPPPHSGAPDHRRHAARLRRPQGGGASPCPGVPESGSAAPAACPAPAPWRPIRSGEGRLVDQQRGGDAGAPRSPRAAAACSQPPATGALAPEPAQACTAAGSDGRHRVGATAGAAAGAAVAAGAGHSHAAAAGAATSSCKSPCRKRRARLRCVGVAAAAE
jgi:hypothetical protein